MEILNDVSEWTNGKSVWLLHVSVKEKISYDDIQVLISKVLQERFEWDYNKMEI